MPVKRILVSLKEKDRVNMTLEEVESLVSRKIFSSLEFISKLKVLPLTNNTQAKVKKSMNRHNPYKTEIERRIIFGNFRDGNGDSYYITDISYPKGIESSRRRIIGECTYTQQQIQELIEEDELTRDKS